MDWYKKAAIHLPPLILIMSNNASKKPRLVKNIRLQIIVYLQINKILNNKYSTMGQLLPLFQFIEIF